MRRLVFAMLMAGACGSRMDEYFLKYETYPSLGSRATWRVVVLPLQGYTEYTELPREPGNALWVHMMDGLEKTGRFQLALRDTGRVREKLRQKAPSWESFPEAGAAKAVGFELGAEAVCVIKVKQILTGHKNNDPDQPLYYEVVLITDIYDVSSGQLLYHARSRGKVYEDLTGAMIQAGDNALKPLKVEQ